MPENRQTFRGLLLAIFKHQKVAWQETGIPAIARTTYEGLISRWPSIEEETLEKTLPSTTTSAAEFPPRRYLYLPPLRKSSELVAFLSLKCDLDTPSEARISLVLNKKDGDRMRSMGLRLEAPHSGKEGMHNFYHAQFFSELKLTGQSLTETWLPVTQPSLPLPAWEEISMFICLLISLYGSEWQTALGGKSVFNLPKYAKEVQRRCKENP